MSMPLIEKIEQTMFMGPCTWTLRTDKGKIIHVRYKLGDLSCRFDNAFTGDKFFTQTKPGHQPVNITTQEMLDRCGFRLVHDAYLPTVHCG